MAEPRSITLTDADLVLARDQFRSINTAESVIRRRIKADHEYIDGAADDREGNPVGKMWSDAERRDRAGRPTLEVDMLSGPIAQVSNGLAEAKPAADMVPLGGGSSPEKAEVWEGMLRRIQTTPEAEFAGAYAADHLVKTGRGAWLLRAKFPEYNGSPDDPANWEMELGRTWIENQHAVFLGPATEPDGSDRLFGFILQPLTKELFNEKFATGDTDEFTEAKAAYNALGADEQAGMGLWDGPDTVTVASWYRVKTKPVTLTGQTAGGPRTRVVKARYVCHSVITATKEYAYEELPIPYLPIVMGEAKRTNIDGVRDVRGMVRRGRQPQDMVNVWNSYIAETIARASRQEVIAAAGQISGGFEKFWNMTERLLWREYNPVSVEGKLAPPPAIVSAEPPIQAMSLALQQAESNVLKSTLHYDASADETNAKRSKESGVARQMRQRQGELGSSDYMRAYGFMVQYETKILIWWIPKVYEAARVMRIVGRDEAPMTAVTYFGEDFKADAEQKAAEMGGVSDEGVKGIFDLSSTRYDIKTRLSKNPLTQRQENVEFLTELAPALPPEMQMKIVPIMLEESDGTVAKKVASALKPKDGTITVEQAQQAQQMIDQLTQTVEEQGRQLETKAVENQSRERIAMAEIEAKKAIEGAKLVQELDLERAKMEHETKMKEYELRQMAAQLEFDEHQASLGRGHEASEAERSRQHASAEGDHAAAREFALREEPEAEAGK